MCLVSDLPQGAQPTRNGRKKGLLVQHVCESVVLEVTDQFDPVPSTKGDARRRLGRRIFAIIPGHLDGHEEKLHGQWNVLSRVRRFRGLEHIERVLRREEQDVGQGL